MNIISYAFTVIYGAFMLYIGGIYGVYRE